MNTILFLAIVGFLAYRTYFFYKHVFANNKVMADVKRTNSDLIGSHLLNILYFLVYFSALCVWYAYGFSTWSMILCLALSAYSWHLRQTAIKDLDKSYGHEIKIFENHKLIVNGIYSKIRHPLYSGLIIDLLGVAIMANFWLTWIFFLGFVLNTLRRVSLEDMALLKVFGDEADKYQKEVSKFNIFKIYN